MTDDKKDMGFMIPGIWNEISSVGNPDHTSDYLIFTKQGNQYVARWAPRTRYYWEYSINCECCGAEGDLFDQSDVTHWMALPKDPIQIKKAE